MHLHSVFDLLWEHGSRSTSKGANFFVLTSKGANFSVLQKKIPAYSMKARSKRKFQTKKKESQTIKSKKQKREPSEEEEAPTTKDIKRLEPPVEEDSETSTTDIKGIFVRTFAGSQGIELTQPYYIAAAGQELFATDCVGNRLVVFGPEGNQLLHGQTVLTIVSKSSAPTVSSYAHGDLLGKRMVSLINRGDWLFKTTCCTCDCQNFRKQTFDLDGRFLQTWGYRGEQGGQFSLPMGVASDDRVFIADQAYDRVHVFTFDGTFVRVMAAKSFSSLCDVAVNEVRRKGEGSKQIIVGGRECIRVFDTGGSFLRSFGSEDKHGLAEPTGLCVHRNRLYVIDYGNCRVQVYQ
eukprot:g61425.t1